MTQAFLRYIQRKKLTVWVAVVWTMLIFIACLIPGNEVPDIHIPFADKWVHFLIFAGFSFFWLCTVPHARIRKGIFVFLLSVLLGIVVELLQGSGITRGRTCEPMDAMADTVGGLLGVLLFFVIRKMAKPGPGPF